MPNAGKWKKEVGWELIDLYVEDAGGLKIHGGEVTYEDIRALCFEISGSAPSKATLSNHFNPAVRAKTLQRQKERRASFKGHLEKRVYKFQRSSKKYVKPKKVLTSYKTIREVLQYRLKDFRRHKENQQTMNHIDNYIEQWTKAQNFKITKLEQEAVADCYICGEPVKIEIKGKDFQLDHIVPVSKGGGAERENCAIVHRDCNQIKSDLSVKELLVVAKKIIKNHEENRKI